MKLNRKNLLLATTATISVGNTTGTNTYTGDTVISADTLRMSKNLIQSSTNSFINHGGSFAAVPGPTSASVGLLIGAGLLRPRRQGYDGQGRRRGKNVES